MQTAIYPGSFDPVTEGHLNIIRRAAHIFDHLIICVVINPKKKFAFSLGERVDMLRRVTADLPNVEIDSWDGLLVDYADRYENPIIVRGLRALSDFEYEFMMALTNKKMNPRVETIFLSSSEEYTYLSSSTVKEIAHYGADISEFIPEAILAEVSARLKGGEV